MVNLYNKFMGSVDLCDILLSLYRIPLKSRKYYVPIFYYLLKICVTNSWLLYRCHVTMKNTKTKKRKHMSLLEFRIHIVDDLLSPGKPISVTPKKGRPSSSLTEETQSKRAKLQQLCLYLQGLLAMIVLIIFLYLMTKSIGVDFV